MCTQSRAAAATLHSRLASPAAACPSRTSARRPTARASRRGQALSGQRDRPLLARWPRSSGPEQPSMLKSALLSPWGCRRSWPAQFPCARPPFHRVRPLASRRPLLAALLAPAPVAAPAAPACIFVAGIGVLRGRSCRAAAVPAGAGSGCAEGPDVGPSTSAAVGGRGRGRSSYTGGRGVGARGRGGGRGRGRSLNGGGAAGEGSSLRDNREQAEGRRGEGGRSATASLRLRGREHPLADLQALASLLSSPPAPLAEWSAVDLCAAFNRAGKVCRVRLTGHGLFLISLPDIVSIRC